MVLSARHVKQMAKQIIFLVLRPHVAVIHIYVVKFIFKALHFPDLSVKHYPMQAGAGKSSVLCGYLSVITVIMNRELSPIKEKGKNIGHDYSTQHFLICVCSGLVSCLLNMILNWFITVKENYDTLSCAV